MQQLRIVLPGARCNLHCKYCLDGYGAETHDRVESSFTTIYDIGRLLSAVKPFTFKYIGIWGGEPLLNRHLEPSLRALRHRYPDTPMGLLSNGTLLNKDWVKLLNELDVGLTISHDGPAQSLCRCADYLTPAYINLLHDLRHFKGTNSVLHRLNCDPWEIYQFFRDKGLPKDAQVNFEPFKLTDYRFTDYLPGPGEYKKFYSGWKAVFTAAKAGEARLRSELIKAGNKLKGHGRTSCGADRRLTVDFAGNIYHCQVAAETGQKGKIDNALPYWCEGCRHARRCRGICPLIPNVYRQKMCLLYHLYLDAAEEELGNG